MLLLFLALLSGAAPVIEADAGSPAFSREIALSVADVAPLYPVPAALVKAVIREESGCDPKAVSRVGAVGLMQVMPGTALKLGIAPLNLVDPAHNILAGTRLLAALLKHYRGDLIATLIAYNAGPRPAQAPVPPNGETPAYLFRVLRTFRWLTQHPAAAPCSSLQ